MIVYILLVLVFVLSQEYCNNESLLYCMVIGPKSLNSPAAVPQLGGTHHADLKRLSMRSLLKWVTLRWICRRFSTNAKPTPTAKSRQPRTKSDLMRPWLLLDEGEGAEEEVVKVEGWCREGDGRS